MPLKYTLDDSYHGRFVGTLYIGGAMLREPGHTRDVYTRGMSAKCLDAKFLRCSCKDL